MKLKNVTDLDFSNLTESSSTSKNFDHTKLYAFISKQKKVPVLADGEKKEIRKKLQKYTPSELQADKNLLFAIVLSDWHIANASKQKYLLFKDVINTFIKENS